MVTFFYTIPNLYETSFEHPYAPSRWVNLFDALELAILEACDGTRTVTELIADFTSADNDDPSWEGSEEGDIEEEVNEEEILVRLQRLWDLTLVHF